MADGDFDKLSEKYPPDKKDEEIASLTESLQNCKDSKKEERFLWVLIAIILFNVPVFNDMENWGGPIAILVLEVIFLLIIARKCGIDEIERWLDKYLSSKKNTD